MNHKLIPFRYIVKYQDTLIALAIWIAALFAYVRTLAPDLLYSDSAEFQTLAYTLGTTHSTGYPTYLLLARLVGILPLRTPAWRINLVSALSAAVTVSGVYLLARSLTSNRLGAALGSLALGLSGIFWSQAIIAEVYTPALAWLTLILLLLQHWETRFPNAGWAVLTAAALAGLGLGMHMYIAPIAPAAIVLVTWRVLAAHEPHRWRHLGLAALGTAIGLLLLLGGFLLLDLHNPPSNFVDVAIRPSRSLWSLHESDLDTPFERIWLTISGRQWQDAMFPEGRFWRPEEIGEYIDLLAQEFSWATRLCAVVGLAVMVWRRPRWGLFMLLTLFITVWVISNYHPGDQQLFYLPTWVLIAVATGIGAGVIGEQVGVWTAPPPTGLGEHTPNPSRYGLSTTLLLGALILWPFAGTRWQALQSGSVPFAANTYAYPVENLAQPRLQAQLQVSYVPDEAVLVLDWRGLYSAIYLTHVEQRRTGLTFIEATPHGNTGQLADSLIADLKQMVSAGRPVFVDQVYEPLRSHFRVIPAPLSGLYRLKNPR